jgi:hypothetical protein
MVLLGLKKSEDDNVRSFDVKPRFSIRAVDGLRGDEEQETKNSGHFAAMVRGVPALLSKSIVNHPDDDPTLGTVLGKFVGTFRYVNWLNRRMVKLTGL